MPTTAHLLQRAIDCHGKGDASGVLANCSRILEKDPRHMDALHLSGLMQLQLGNLDQAENLIKAAIAVNPKFAAFHSNLGTVQTTTGKLDEALASYRTATELDPNFLDAWSNLGNLASRIGDHALAAQCFSVLVERSEGRDGQALGYLSLAQSVLCDWPKVEACKAIILSQNKGWLRPIPPFTVLPQEFTPIQQRAIAEYTAYAIHMEAAKAANNFTFFHPPQPTRPKKLRVGYISDDFKDHAVAYLVVGLFEACDKERFETFVFSYGPPNDSPVRQRIAAAVDHFIEIAPLSWRQSADVIFQNKIDILIDLKGHTGIPRPQIFALRPAPIQVAWLGYPGTFGGPDMDYILADAYVIPEGAEEFYSEIPIRLPHCYQPNDPKRHCAATRVTKAAAGLPDAFVFGALNNSFKITEPGFDAWMALLRDCPHSVLWLLDHHPTATANLKAAAAARGVTADRLIFAPRVVQDQHLERLSAVDLALDTYPYGGHTTTSDFLWAGVPVVALAGETFASRVAGSLLTNVGLPELIASSWDEYRAKAQALYADPQRLADLRQHLEKARSTQPLFDAQSFARDFERALDRIWSLGKPKRG